jgi:hypothetical protein
VPRIAYEYRVGGQIYRSNRVWAGEAVFGTSDEAHRVVERYRPRQAVTVYYDPDDPATAVLEPGGNWTRWLHMVVIGTMLTAMGFAMVGIAAWGWWTLGKASPRQVNRRGAAGSHGSWRSS